MRGMLGVFFCHCLLQLCDKWKENYKYLFPTKTERAVYLDDFREFPSKLRIFRIFVFSYLLWAVFFVCRLYLLFVNCWSLVVKCRLSSAWLSSINIGGCSWFLVVGSRLLGVGCRVLAVDCWCRLSLTLFPLSVPSSVSECLDKSRGRGRGGVGRGDHLLFKNLVSEMPKCHVLDKQKNRLKPGLISSEVKLNVLQLNLQTEKDKFKPDTKCDGFSKSTNTFSKKRRLGLESGHGLTWVLDFEKSAAFGKRRSWIFGKWGLDFEKG
jgi:hypothetical protein